MAAYKNGRIDLEWVRGTHLFKHQPCVRAMVTELAEAREALRKIYEYRSDKPDWNMVMAIAGDVVDPQVAVLSKVQNSDSE